MNPSTPPFETMVFVCTHQRPGGDRIACANPGREGQEILEELRKKVHEKGLTGKVRICKSGCMDRCEEGPNILVVRSGGKTNWLRDSTIKNIDNLCDIIFKND